MKSRIVSGAARGKSWHIDKAVSKWENGRAEPDVLSRLADVLSVTADDLLHKAPSGKRITMIVIAGGPCAGKTTAMSRIQNAFAGPGYAVSGLFQSCACRNPVTEG